MPEDKELETAYRLGREDAQAVVMQAGAMPVNRYLPNTPCAFAWQIGFDQVEQEMRDPEEGERMILKPVNYIRD
jgi:hypothetical protein